MSGAPGGGAVVRRYSAPRTPAPMAARGWLCLVLVLAQCVVLAQPFALGGCSGAGARWRGAAQASCARTRGAQPWPAPVPCSGSPQRAPVPLALRGGSRDRQQASHVQLARRHTKRATGREDGLDELQRLLGFAFSNSSVLAQAVTHRSAAKKALDSNQRLEYLGDAVLGMVVAEHLFQTFPAFDEGRLSSIRKEVVSASALARVARRHDLGRFAQLNAGEESTGGRNKEALLADLVEALIAAVFVDGGLDAARTVVLRWLEEDIRLAARDPSGSDFKSKLQEALRRIRMPDPVYHVVETGPKHNQKFTAHALVAERRLGWGTGKSKKAAEQAAAQYSIQVLEDKEPAELLQWCALPSTTNSLDHQPPSSDSRNEGA